MEGQIVRRLGKDGEEGDDGWIDHASVSLSLPPNTANHILDRLFVEPKRHPGQTVSPGIPRHRP